MTRPNPITVTLKDGRTMAVYDVRQVNEWIEEMKAEVAHWKLQATKP